MHPQIAKFFEQQTRTVSIGGVDWTVGPLPAVHAIELMNEFSKDASVTEQHLWRSRVVASGLFPQADAKDCERLPLHIVRELSDAILESSLKKSPEAG